MTTLADVLLDDLESLFGEHGWAEDAAFRPVEGAERQVRVVFEAAYQEVDLKTKAPIGSVAPAAWLDARSLPEELEEDDRLVIRNQAYRIVVAKPDGHGAVLCRLQRVAA